MSLHAMAETVRAEQRRREAAAPAARRKHKAARASQWKEAKRRAWNKARPVFEGAFGREFAPGRFTYTPGERNRCQLVKVSINYEGKLLAYCNVYNGEDRTPVLQVRPIDAPEDSEKMIQCAPEAMYDELAKLIEKWGLA